MSTNDERLLAAAIYVISFFTAFIGPLVIWLVKKDESSFIDYHGKEYFNFFISYTIYGVISGLSILLFIGFLLVPIVGLYVFVFTIVAAVKAYGGEEYRIPFILRLIR